VASPAFVAQRRQVAGQAVGRPGEQPAAPSGVASISRAGSPPASGWRFRRRTTAVRPGGTVIAGRSSVFGGPKPNLLFVCATTSVYSIMLNVTGA
jgi:hypothetical protein